MPLDLQRFDPRMSMGTIPIFPIPLTGPPPMSTLTLRGSLDPTTGIFYRAPERARVRTPLACDKCRVRKAKCTGDRPVCERCRARGLTCHYTDTMRMVERRKIKIKIKHKDRDRVERRGDIQRDGSGSRRRSDSCSPPARCGAHVDIDSGTASECTGLDVPRGELKRDAEESTGVLAPQDAFDPVAYTANADPILDFDAMLAPGFIEPSQTARRVDKMLEKRDPICLLPDLNEANPPNCVMVDGAQYQHHVSFRSTCENVSSVDLHAQTPGRTPSICTPTLTSASPVLTRTYSPTPVNGYPGSPFALASPSPLGHNYPLPLSTGDTSITWCERSNEIGSHTLGGGMPLFLDGVLM